MPRARRDVEHREAPVPSAGESHRLIGFGDSEEGRAWLADLPILLQGA
jgi:hypothetical protein